MARCVAEYCAKLLPKFIDHLCSIKVWDSSVRCLSSLIGSKLVDFWSSSDKAILKAILSIFMEKWDLLAARFYVSFFVLLFTEEESTTLRGGRFCWSLI
ncbi:MULTISPECIES: hypothetical protein [Candidatus Ichthyocystis]|uniref:hypothetical protein n=1 Tax=Candidatus Ichthyocystis TaxID=2929841 RepID=UPI000B823B05|nr:MULTISPECIES: hypothetical protein [Ichthyocystis]